MIYRSFGKRALDVTLVLATAVVWVPVLALAAAVVLVRMGRPVLFAQARPGYRGRPFDLYKLRTMTDERDETGRLLPDELRLTATGAWLRRWSFDELPELWNVLRGDMSLVGPRPLHMRYLERYTADQSRRHDVRPGVTGLAQVRGRNAISWERRFELDLEYVDRHGLLLDLAVLAQTVPVMLRGSGVTAEGHATMPEYRGPTPPAGT